MIEEFKADLKSLNSLQIYRKYVLGGDCHLLDNHQMFEIRETICDKFEIDFTDVIMVGSGKLGFSIKPSRRFEVFNDDSDIDIAIVSTKLFERIWQEAYLFKKSGADWPSSNNFFKYISEGWIRPDKLPSSSYFEFTDEWWKFFNSLTSSNRFGPFKVRGGLYHSHFFLQEYQTICIEQCIQEAS
ncbi:hypothetical protein ACFFLG_18210 [Shewanella indica]|uniref:hypothetical protein n=1 Tax=Shewanella TaxID=22 RepID=UPI000C349BEA|nr:hypothetical protein [Shewanella indica]GHB08079.1 hypothetical protein GCM10007107_21400 [Shewanella indica]